MPPKKNFADTWRGKRARKKEETAKKKEDKLREKEERRRLNAEGLCRVPDGEVYTHAEVGKKFGRVAWQEATEEEKENRMECGRRGGGETWERMSDEDRHKCMEAGKTWWTNLTKEDADGFAEGMIQAWLQLSKNVQEGILENLGVHADVARGIRTMEAEERYDVEGDPVIVPDLEVWNCEGCELQCAKRVKWLSFAGVSDRKMMKWMVSHKLMVPSCQITGCGGRKCYPIARGNECGLKCPDCG